VGFLRFGVLIAALTAALVSLAALDVDISICIGWAFSVAAFTITPLLVLAIWTDRLTPAGAAAGTILRATLASAGVLITTLSPPRAGWLAALLAEPAPVCLVAAAATMLIVSGHTRRAIDQSASLLALARIHRAES
jgi:cation/acetate symporter